ncbi:MAG: hypothetical protein RLZZ262_2551 [Bacteroidota bacterium]
MRLISGCENCWFVLFKCDKNRPLHVLWFTSVLNVAPHFLACANQTKLSLLKAIHLNRNNKNEHSNSNFL